MRMTWRDVLFLHWPVAEADLRPYVPPQFEIDLFEGNAWIGLVPFLMEDVRPSLARVPIPPIPKLAPSAFPECNVRTYVKHRDRPGVWFMSLDASPLFSVLGARMLWHLNYCWSRFHVNREGNTIDYQLQRRKGRARCVRGTSPAWRLPDPQGEPASTHVRWTLGEAMPAAKPGSREHFLTARYSLYSLHKGVVLDGRVEHTPWTLRNANVEHLEDTLVRTSSIQVSGDPIAFASDGVETVASPLLPCH